MTVTAVIALLATQTSGAAGVPSPPDRSRTLSLVGSRAAPDSLLGTKRRASPQACPSARKAVRFYSRRLAEHRAKMGAARVSPNTSRASGGGCPRYLAKVLQRKARVWRLRAAVWLKHHYSWTTWLPDKWARIGACETGYGRRPGSWTWDSGTYVSAFGIYRPGYSQFAHAIGQLSWDETRSRLGRYPTPREQWNVALEIYRRYGFSGWGCRNA